MLCARRCRSEASPTSDAAAAENGDSFSDIAKNTAFSALLSFGGNLLPDGEITQDEVNLSKIENGGTSPEVGYMVDPNVTSALSAANGAFTAGSDVSDADSVYTMFQTDSNGNLDPNFPTVVAIGPSGNIQSLSGN